MTAVDPAQRDPRTYAIIGAAMEVHRQLGPGFHEAVYLEALRIELNRRKIPFDHEVGLRIRYKDQILDTRYRADLICYGTVLVELKTLAHLSGTEEAQLLNYMKATGCEVGLLLNFGTASLYYKRYAYNPRWKPIASSTPQPESTTSALHSEPSVGAPARKESTSPMHECGPSARPPIHPNEHMRLHASHGSLQSFQSASSVDSPRSPSPMHSVAPQFGPELDTAIAAARAAGEILLEYRGSSFNVREKSDRTLLTDADSAAEAEILSRLRDAYPDDAILSEEAGETGRASSRQWIVDPLDGTTNFSRGLPYFAVSIALWVEGEPAAGVVYLPVLDELFAAVKGEPATLNGKEIRVSDISPVRDAMINCYFDRHQRLEEGLEIFTHVARACEGRVKVMGSTASLLCYVACGRIDAFIRNTTRQWDFAAGALVLERAGGRLSDFAGNPLRESGQSLLATNDCIHEELRKIVRGEPATRS